MDITSPHLPQSKNVIIWKGLKMKCYNHHDRDAFGICQACGKALCLECMDVTENITNCNNNDRCKTRVKSINKAYSRLDMSASSTTINLSLIIWSLFIIAGLVGVFSTFLFRFDLFTLILSVIFIFMGINSIIFIKKSKSNLM